MAIPLPPGYSSAVALDKSKHRQLGVRPDAAKFASTLHVVYVTAAEFPIACHDYAIVFALDSNEELVPVVLTGLQPGSNLFVDASGQWLQHVYCPAYVRRYPFFTVTVDGGNENEALICVDENGLEAGRSSLLDASGEPTAIWHEREVLINELDTEQRNTSYFCRQLQALDLVEAFDADFHPRGLEDVRVAGLYRVSERRLLDLPENDQLKLLRSGQLSRIYAHLLSLENMNNILTRYVAAAGKKVNISP